MLIVSPGTANALAARTEARSFVMFVQVNAPGVIAGPVLIEGVKGYKLGGRLWELVQANPYEPMLIGLLETPEPEQLAHQIRDRYEQDRTHGGWFAPSVELMAFIRETSQHALEQLILETQPGALPDKALTIDELAQLLGISTKTIRRMVDKHQIPYMRLGRAFRFVPKDVVASLRAQQLI